MGVLCFVSLAVCRCSATLAGCGGLPHAVQCDIEEQRRVQQDHKAIMQGPVSGGGAEGG